MGSRPSKAPRGSSAQAAQLDQGEPAEAILPVCVSDSSRFVVVALHSSGGPDQVSIRVGERLDILVDEGEWWQVRSSASGKESFIPSTHTAKVYHGWQYEGLSREKAEELLLLPYNQNGSFLIRESETHPGGYSLSIRTSGPQEGGRGSIRHYRIRRLDNSWHFISPGLTFPTLAAMVEHYSGVTDGLCCLLGEPCFIQGSNNVPVVNGPTPVAVRKPTLNWREVDRSMIFDKVEGQEDSLVSEGLREAISSYLLLTNDSTDCSKCWDS